MLIAWAALMPLITTLGGTLIDRLFGRRGSSPQQVVQQQQEASRFNVYNPFGFSEWRDGNLVQEMSPEMQAMVRNQMDFRNSALENALAWFGSPSSPSNMGNNSSGPPSNEPWVPDDSPAFPDWLNMDWDERWERARELWGDNPGDWGRDGNVGIPFWMFERGQFPKNLDPASLQTWWMNQGQDIGPINPY